MIDESVSISAMQWISWSYALPAVVFLVVAFGWYAVVYSGGRMRRIFAVTPVMGCYLVAGILLLSGGCHRIAHVKLEGVEVDLQDRAGKDRPIVIGGKGGDMDPAVYVPGYPVDALRLRLHGKRLLLTPGPGYRRDILVRSGGKLISLERGGTPKLVPLEDGDKILVGAKAGGGSSIEWVLGEGKYDFTPKADIRWLGGRSSGLARAPGYPDKVLGIKKVREGVQLIRGDEMPQDARVAVNGHAVDFTEKSVRTIRYQPGQTRLELMRKDPLAGVVTWRSSGVMESEAMLNFEGVARSIPFTLEAGKAMTMGGSARDDLFVKGMPKSAMRLLIEEGRLILQENAGEKVRHVGDREGWQLQVGDKDSPSGGVLVLKKVVKSAVAPVSERAADSVGETTGEASAKLVTGTAPVSKVIRMLCEWTPNAVTRWRLPNRRVTLPMVEYEVPVFVRHKWKLKVYPLANLTGRESSLRSCVVYGAEGLGRNQAGLLVMDPGVTVERAGKTLTTSTEPMYIDSGKTLEFLQLMSIEEGGVSNTVRTVAQTGRSTEIKKVRKRRKTGPVSLHVREDERGVKIPYVEMRYTEPVIREIPIEDLENDVEANEALEGRLAFGLNEQSEFASLPHQVRFRSLTNWFRKANGEVEMNRGGLRVQDDYGRVYVEYGEHFTVGGEDRLMMKVDKMTVPWSAISWVVMAALLSLVVCWHWCGSFAGMALFFGVALLTCSRVLFGQAVLVNAPYDPSALHAALRVMMVLPLLLSVLWALSEKLSGGWVYRLRCWVAARPYWVLALAAGGFLVLRLGLLLLGVKEGFDAGGSRVALSIIFVPAWLLLFAAGMAKVTGRSGHDSRQKLMLFWKHLCFCGWLFLCQGVSGLAVSDMGVFVYLIPQALVLAIMSIWYVKQELETRAKIKEAEVAKDADETSTKIQHKKNRKALLAKGFCQLCLLLPLVLILIFCFKPHLMMGNISKFNDPLMDREEIPTDSTALRVLQFLDKDYLINLGTDAAEEIAQDHAIMENYAHRGLIGQGYLQVDVISAKRVTAMNDNVSAVYIFGQFGVVGACAVLLAYLAIALAGFGAGSKMSDWAGALAALSFALTSIYMLAANWGMMPFTGRNMYLLGLNSWGDVIESAALLCIIVVARGFSRNSNNQRDGGNPELDTLANKSLTR